MASLSVALFDKDDFSLFFYSMLNQYSDPGAPVNLFLTSLASTSLNFPPFDTCTTFYSNMGV